MGTGHQQGGGQCLPPRGEGGGPCSLASRDLSPGPVGLCQRQVQAEEAQLQELGGGGPGWLEGRCGPAGLPPGRAGPWGLAVPPGVGAEPGQREEEMGRQEQGWGTPGPGSSWRAGPSGPRAPRSTTGPGRAAQVGSADTAAGQLHRVHSFLDYVMGGCQIHCTVSPRVPCSSGWAHGASQGHPQEVTWPGLACF